MITMRTMRTMRTMWTSWINRKVDEKIRMKKIIMKYFFWNASHHFWHDLLVLLEELRYALI